jgi:spermidine synthase
VNAVAGYGAGAVPPVPKIQVFHEAGQRLELRDLGSHVELMIGRVPILTSKSLGTELAFGQLAASIKTPYPPRVLIGGLGFGRTLAGVLESVGPGAEVILVEKLTTVIGLVRGELAHLSPGVLDDPRVRLVQDDVASVIARERDLDMILLDVDNGPNWASFRSNSRLYGPLGLQKARVSLRQGGAYVVWSGYQADAFLKDLRRAGFIASAIPLRERGKVRARAYVGRTR